MGGGVPPRPETLCRTIAPGARSTEAAAGVGHRVELSVPTLSVPCSLASNVPSLSVPVSWVNISAREQLRFVCGGGSLE